MSVLLTETVSDVITENVTDTVSQVAENPGVIKTWIKDSIPGLLNAGVHILLVILILIIGMKVIKWSVSLLKKALEKSKIDAGVSSFLCSLAKYVLYFMLVMVLLGEFGITTGSIVALLGSAGLTVGLALQGSLSNFAGGVLILILRPFMIGDYIVDHSSGQEGTVTAISICYTKLTTPDNRVIMVPNGALSNATITNASRLPKRRVDLTVGVSYEANLQEVKEVLAKTVAAEDKILADEEVMIFVNSLASSSVDMGVRVWVNSADYWAVKWNLTEHIKNALDEAGISIPYNQLDVHLTK